MLTEEEKTYFAKEQRTKQILDNLKHLAPMSTGGADLDRFDCLPVHLISGFYHIAKGDDDRKSDFISMYWDISKELKLSDFLDWMSEYLDRGEHRKLDLILAIFMLETFGSLEQGIFELGIEYSNDHGADKNKKASWYFNEALRHYFLYKAQDSSERHDRLFMWNIVELYRTCIHSKDSLNDLPYVEYDAKYNVAREALLNELYQLNPKLHPDYVDPDEETEF